MSGVRVLPVSLTLVPTSMVVGALMTKSGKFQWALWTGWSILLLATGLLILLDEETSTVRWVFIFITLGIGQGAIMPPLIFSTQAMAKTEDVAYAAAMFPFLRSLGYTIGVAIGGTAVQNALSHRLADAALPVSIAKNAEAYLTVLNALPRGSLEYRQLVHAYAEAFKTVWEIMIAFTALGLIFSLGIAHHSLDRKYDSRHKLNRPDQVE